MRKLIRSVIGNTFKYSYGLDKVTIQVGAISGLEFTVKMSELREKMSMWVGKPPKNREQYKEFWLDILPNRNIARTICVTGFQMKVYYTKKQLIDLFEKAKWNIRKLKKIDKEKHRLYSIFSGGKNGKEKTR